MLVIEDAFWSAIAALGFATLFNVPTRTRWACMLCAAIGHAIRTLLVKEFEVSIVPATLVGSTVIGFLGICLAHQLKAPTPVFTVSGVIPMVPGVFAYRSMLGILRLVEADATAGNIILTELTINATKAFLIVGALGLGIIVPHLLFQRNRPVV